MNLHATNEQGGKGTIGGLICEDTIKWFRPLTKPQIESIFLALNNWCASVLREWMADISIFNDVGKNQQSSLDGGNLRQKPVQDMHRIQR